MEPIVPITLRIPDIPAVERVVKRTDPDHQKREQQRREQKKREPEEPHTPEAPPEDDGLPHIDINV